MDQSLSHATDCFVDLGSGIDQNLNIFPTVTFNQNVGRKTDQVASQQILQTILDENQYQDFINQHYLEQNSIFKNLDKFQDKLYFAILLKNTYSVALQGDFDVNSQIMTDDIQDITDEQGLENFYQLYGSRIVTQYQYDSYFQALITIECPDQEKNLQAITLRQKLQALLMNYDIPQKQIPISNIVFYSNFTDNWILDKLDTLEQLVFYTKQFYQATPQTGSFRFKANKITTQPWTIVRQFRNNLQALKLINQQRFTYPQNQKQVCEKVATVQRIPCQWLQIQVQFNSNQLYYIKSNQNWLLSVHPYHGRDIYMESIYANCHKTCNSINKWKLIKSEYDYTYQIIMGEDLFYQKCLNYTLEITEDQPQQKPSSTYYARCFPEQQKNSYWYITSYNGGNTFQIISARTDGNTFQGQYLATGDPNNVNDIRDHISVYVKMEKRLLESCEWVIQPVI